MHTNMTVPVCSKRTATICTIAIELNLERRQLETLPRAEKFQPIAPSPTTVQNSVDSHRWIQNVSLLVGNIEASSR